MSDKPVGNSNPPNPFPYGPMFEEHLPKDKICGYIRKLSRFDLNSDALGTLTMGFFDPKGELKAAGHGINGLISVIKDWDLEVYSLH